MDPISSVWRAGITVEAIYPPQHHLGWDLWSLRITIFRKNLSPYLGLRCPKWMPWRWVYVITGSSNLYGPYIKCLKSWDSNGDGLSTPTTTWIGIRGPSKSRFCKNLSPHLCVRFCKWMSWGWVWACITFSGRFKVKKTCSSTFYHTPPKYVC